MSSNPDATAATPHTLTVLIPCYNEEQTLESCVARVLELACETLALEIIVIDDCSTDRSRDIALGLEQRHPAVRVLLHETNQGKGAALHTGIAAATGDFIAVQDADLEYDPQDLLRLIEPLKADRADVTLGSRFAAHGPHRVLYFWHSMGNKFLTLLSNMCTDLNLTDMETCYKVFKRELLQSLELKEKRFGFEPEVVAVIARRRVRVVEMGVSYFGRTYEEGKKIGFGDGLRALYCIFRYNAYTLNAPAQFVFYAMVGGVCGVFNLLLFLGLMRTGVEVGVATPIAFVAAAILNYLLCTALIFRRGAKWGWAAELLVYAAAVAVIGLVDRYVTMAMLATFGAATAKISATFVGLVMNFAARRLLVFPEKSQRGPWMPQDDSPSASG